MGLMESISYTRDNNMLIETSSISLREGKELLDESAGEYLVTNGLECDVTYI